MLFEKFAALTEFVNTHKKETISKKKLNKRKDGREHSKHILPLTYS